MKAIFKIDFLITQISKLLAAAYEITKKVSVLAEKQNKLLPTSLIK